MYLYELYFLSHKIAHTLSLFLYLHSDRFPCILRGPCHWIMDEIYCSYLLWKQKAISNFNVQDPLSTRLRDGKRWCSNYTGIRTMTCHIKWILQISDVGSELLKNRMAQTWPQRFTQTTILLRYCNVLKWNIIVNSVTDRES